ncbi:MAG: HAD family phosphatase [Pseudonocardia sp.]|nr:HAD family phosphatase [Pseudonocardia sp.]
MPADASAGVQESHIHEALLQESGFPEAPAAVLFDMDGTLIDSEKAWDKSLVDLLRWLVGSDTADLTSEARATTLGGSLATSLAMVFREAGIDPDPELLARAGRRLVDRTGELLTEGVEWRPGAQSALRTMREAGIPTALVTNTGRHLTEMALVQIGRENFAVTICGDEVPRGKPAPDPYLRAAELLGVAVEDCVAIEDSPTGVAAAEAAGATVLVVPCEVPVPGGPRRVLRQSLVGLTVGDLAAARDRVRTGV